MNEYNILFSIFLIVGENKISTKNHFSNCHATIKGESYEEALKSLKEEKRKEGWHVVTLEEIYR
jgi:hypothetical protein